MAPQRSLCVRNARLHFHFYPPLLRSSIPRNESPEPNTSRACFEVTPGRTTRWQNRLKRPHDISASRGTIRHTGATLVTGRGRSGQGVATEVGADAQDVDVFHAIINGNELLHALLLVAEGYYNNILKL